MTSFNKSVMDRKITKLIYSGRYPPPISIGAGRFFFASNPRVLIPYNKKIMWVSRLNGGEGGIRTLAGPYGPLQL